MLDQHTLILPCMLASQLVHMTKACGFIYTSFWPVKTKLYMKQDYLADNDDVITTMSSD